LAGQTDNVFFTVFELNFSLIFKINLN